MLVQLPIIFALYNIIRNPLTYISGFSVDLIENVKKFIFENSEVYAHIVNGLGKLNETGQYVRTINEAKNIQQITIIEIFNNPEWLAEIKANVIGMPGDFINLNFNFLGQLLTSAPAQAGLSILLLIPVLNFAASFLQTRLTKMINASTMANDAANNKGMKIMEYTMPLLIVWMAYQMYAALGLYWVFQSVLGILQILILSKIYPLPKITEEEYELARIEYGTAKKKKKKPAAELDEDGEIIETVAVDKTEDDGSEPAEINDEKYISKSIPKGINQNAKNNYQKTGKKYTIKKRKK